jgi:hypothetical protein
MQEGRYVCSAAKQISFLDSGETGLSCYLYLNWQFLVIYI